MTGGDFFSYIKTWLSNLFTCVKDFNNNSLEEVFVPLDDETTLNTKIVTEFKPIVPTEPTEPNEPTDYDELPELIPVEQLSSVDSEEYGSEQELEDIENSSDDDDENQYYYRD
jgi:hypothetical protein